MRRAMSSLLLSAAIAVVGASAATAQVEQSGKVFHAAVCARGNPHGTARCHAHVVTDRSGNPIANTISMLPPWAYKPADLQAAYGVVQTVDPNTAPSGPWVAIVDAYGYPNAERDLGVYRSQFKLPPCTTANGCFKKVNQHGVQGSYPASNLGWDQEQALDVQMVSAICPNCRILLVEASTTSFANLGIAEDTAASLGAHAISNSYGGAESGSQAYEGHYDHEADGVAITASTGDSGYSAGPQFPATSPHVTAVGGTSLVRASNPRGWSETVWTGAGSGCSTVYAKPAWQVDTLCAPVSPGVGGRMEADVSAVADPNTGVAVYGPAGAKSSGWLVFGGTSVASPLVAAMYGLANDTQTFVSSLYMTAATPGPYATSPYLDVVTSGNNGTCGGAYLCTADGNGDYNGPTGLGTPAGAGGF